MVARLWLSIDGPQEVRTAGSHVTGQLHVEVTGEALTGVRAVRLLFEGEEHVDAGRYRRRRRRQIGYV